MADERALWGSDVPVSAPVLRRDVGEVLKVPFGGLAFTPSGMVFDLTEADFEAQYLPTYAPDGRAP